MNYLRTYQHYTSNNYPMLKEGSFYDISDDIILSPQFFNSMGEDDYKDLIRIFKKENAIKGNNKQIIINSNFQEYVREVFRDNLEDRIQDISSHIENGSIMIYRNIHVDDKWFDHILKDGKHLGIYWSYNEEAAQSYWHDRDKYTESVTIHSIVKEEYVDWKTTLQIGSHPNYRDEMEIRLFKNTPLKILSIINEEYDELDISTIENKTFYA